MTDQVNCLSTVTLQGAGFGTLADQSLRQILIGCSTDAITGSAATILADRHVRGWRICKKFSGVALVFGCSPYKEYQEPFLVTHSPFLWHCVLAPDPLLLLLLLLLLAATVGPDPGELRRLECGRSVGCYN